MSFARRSESVAVVIVDTDPAQRRLITSHLESRRDGRFVPIACETAEAALEALRQPGTNVLLADIEFVGGTAGLGALARGSAPIIATSSGASLHAAVAAMRAGAADFVAKPIGAAALIERLDSVVAGWNRTDSPAKKPIATHKPKAGDSEFEGFIGRSAPMLSVYEQIRRIAPSRAPVFITGESGSGKEVCARAVHSLSGPDGRPFVAINCSAIPRDLIESEVFGHARGAFTGAFENKPGAAELADGGTLFLDEIGEMDMGLQSKLLRFIQTGMVRRVGGVEERAVNVRFICAMNRDPYAEIRDGRFRQDLFYRLSVLPIILPPLRERHDDILRIAEDALAHYSAEEGRAFAGFDAEARALLLGYAWPGNVRELQNVIRRIVVLYDAAEVTASMLPREIVAAPVASAKAGPGRNAKAGTLAPFWMQERDMIESAIAAFAGNISKAAAALEISPSTIYRKRQAWLERRTG